MGDISLWTGVLIGLGIMVLTVVLVRFFIQRRFNKMKAAGAALGLVPYAKGERFNFIPVELMRKKRRGIGVALHGNWKGQAVLVFDLFHPAIKSVSIQTVLMTNFNDKYFPEFAAIEKNANLYLPTVDLPIAEDAPDEVKKHWLLYTRDGHWPFSTELADWMRENRGRKGWFSVGWSYEGRGTALYVYRRSTTAKPKRLAQWLDEALMEAQEFSRRAEAPKGDFSPDIEFTTVERDSVRVKATFKFEKHFNSTNRGR